MFFPNSSLRFCQSVANADPAFKHRAITTRAKKAIKSIVALAMGQ